ncbi:MAG: type II toxin-antitoxin system RelE/ParE family toxin [Methyloligellaceae bacterium]
MMSFNDYAKMANYQLSIAAQEDLTHLFEDGIIRFGLTQADKYFDGLIERFQFLSENPEAGYNSYDLAPSLQRFPYQRHVIFFTNTGNGLLIVRILGEEMDFKRHLK